jgi:hypothetical protein
VSSRPRARFFRIWEPRVGRAATEIMYRSGRWDLGVLGLLLLLFAGLIIGRVSDVSAPFIVGLVLFVIGAPICTWRSNRINRTAAVEVARFLDYAGDPKRIPLKLASTFDRWRKGILRRSASLEIGCHINLCRHREHPHLPRVARVVPMIGCRRVKALTAPRAPLPGLEGEVITDRLECLVVELRVPRPDHCFDPAGPVS